jgi:hypothetical protein
VPDVPAFPAPTLRVLPWEDLVIDELGHDPRSLYVERFWLGILGPSATWLLRRVAGELEAHPDGFELDLVGTALELGLGHKAGRHAPFVRCIDRCCRFGLARADDATTLLVRRKLPPLTRVQVERLPEHLRREHGRWQEHPTPGSPVVLEQLRQRARQLALSLLQLGEDAPAAERQLHRWRVHPSVAHEAIEWAVARHRQLLAEQEAAARRTAAGGAGPDVPPDPPEAA